MVLFGLLVGGTSVFVVQHLSSQDIQRTELDTLYLAQAGIQYALYQFRQSALTGNGHFSYGKTMVDGNGYSVVGGTSADALIINSQNAALGGSNNREVVNIGMYNTADTNDSVLVSIDVSWQKSAAVRRLQRVYMNNLSRWSGNAVSPAHCDLTDWTFPKDASIATLRLQFSGSMSGLTRVDVQCFMSDGSSRTFTMYPASNVSTVVITSTGKRSTDIYKTVQAEYNVLTSRIVRYQEVGTEMVP